MSAQGGCVLLGGCGSRGCLCFWEGLLPGGGVLPGGDVLPGDVLLGGCFRGVCFQGVCFPACTEADTPREQNDRQV